MPALATRVPTSVLSGKSILASDIVRLTDQDLEQLPQDAEAIDRAEKVASVTLSFDEEENWQLSMLEMMLHQVGFSFSMGGYQHQDGVDILVLELPTDIPVASSPSAAGFGAHLEALKSALLNLSEYFRGINDPDILTAELKATRSYVDAALCFLDEAKYPTGGPEALPGEIAKSTVDKLEKVDPTKVSSEARGWLKIAIEYFKLFLKLDGG